jgi:uncharacterized membrane protein YeaQ/YmgE (transglycosylase-associated protein family)
MKLLRMIAAVVGTFLGKSLGCESILFDAANDRWGSDFGEAVKGMHMLCDEGTKYIVGAGLAAGILGGYLAAGKGYPRLSPVISLIGGFLGAIVAAFLYGKLWSP